MADTKMVLGFIAGAAAGALAGILLAPDSGSATRKYIFGKVKDEAEEIDEVVSHREGEDMIRQVMHKAHEIS